MVDPMVTTIILLVVGVVLAINFYMQNFLAAYISVRAKRDAGVMVGVIGKRGMYFRPGKLEESKLRFKIDRKNKCTIDVSDAQFFRGLGVNWVYGEEGSDGVVTAIEDNQFVGRSADAVTNDNLFVRALHKPNIKSTQDQLVLFGVLASLAVSLFLAWKVMELTDMVRLMRTGSQVVSGGNVP